MKQSKKIFSLILALTMLMSLLTVRAENTVAETGTEENIVAESATEDGAATETGSSGGGGGGSSRPLVPGTPESITIENGLVFTILTEPTAEANGTVALAKGDYTEKSYEIPTTVEKVQEGADPLVYDVVAFDEEAFSGNTTLQDINIPGSVTEIPEACFRGCTSLNYLYFDYDSIATAIHEYAFDGCTALEEIYLPDSITTIAENAFNGCNIFVAQNNTATTENEYDYIITVYGTNTIAAEEMYPSSNDTLIFTEGSKIIVDGILLFAQDTDITPFLSYVEGTGILATMNEDGAITAAYTTAGAPFLMEPDLDFSAEVPPTGENFTYDAETKTLTINDNVFVGGIVTLPDGATIKPLGNVRIEDMEVLDGEDKALFIEGPGVLTMPRIFLDSAFKQTLYVKKGATVKTTMLYGYSLHVAGKLLLSGIETGIQLEGGPLVRTGVGEDGGYIFAETRNMAVDILFPEQDYVLAENALLQKYVQLNNGTETSGYLPKVYSLSYGEGDVHKGISFFDTDVILEDTRPVSRVEIIPPEEIPEPPTPPSGGGGGGGGSRSYRVSYYPGYDGPKPVTENHHRNNTVTVKGADLFTAPEGHTFVGWAEAEDSDVVVYKGGETFKMPAGALAFYALWEKAATPPAPGLNREDHIAYIKGYPDDTFRPQGNITRAETAMIYFRLLDEDTKKAYLTTENPFTDLDGHWAEEAIATLHKAGIADGRTATEYIPDAPITRAEYAVIAARFDKTPLEDYQNPFGDLDGHWAEEEILRAAKLGWLVGDGDGNFRPDDPITRAEAVTLINRVLERNPESVDDLLADMITFTDNTNTSAWYYIDVQESANAHTYERKENGTEKWVALNPSEE